MESWPMSISIRIVESSIDHAILNQLQLCRFLWNGSTPSVRNGMCALASKMKTCQMVGQSSTRRSIHKKECDEQARSGMSADTSFHLNWPCAFIISNFNWFQRKHTHTIAVLASTAAAAAAASALASVHYIYIFLFAYTNSNVRMIYECVINMCVKFLTWSASSLVRGTTAFVAARSKTKKRKKKKKMVLHKFNKYH